MSDVTDAIALRHRLHGAAETSGNEAETAALLVDALRPFGGALETALGGHGVALTFGTRGPRTLLRAELDALPTAGGAAHLCGHDGHSATLWLVAARLAEKPPVNMITLLWQPAEEVGTGAAAVLADRRWRGRRFDRGFAWHNLPSEPFGTVISRAFTICCASTGVRVRFAGRSAHAATPHTGVDLLPRVLRWIDTLPGDRLDSDGVMTTLTHLRLGRANFGATPADAEVNLTLRALTDERLEDEWDRLRSALPDSGEAQQVEPFAATENDEGLVGLLFKTCRATGHPFVNKPTPYRWSEDFGRFATLGPICFFGIGAGDGPALHDPAYTFNDDLVEPAADLLLRLAHDVSNASA